MPAPTPRPYQRDGLDSIATAFSKGTNRVLLKAPTGTGKTVTFAAMLEHPPIKTWLSQFPAHQRRMLVIAHREELLDQACAKIAAANPGLLVSVEQGDRYAAPGSDVVCASIQTLAARQGFRLRRLQQHGTFRIVIVDEAHHAAARTYREALSDLGFLPPIDRTNGEVDIDAIDYTDLGKAERELADWDKRAPQDRLLVGVTATPNRSDAVGLSCVFQTIAFNYGLRQAIDDGWLVPITAWAVETQDCLDDVKVNRGEFNQRELADKVNNATRNKLAVAAWHEHAYNRPTIAFTVDVAHAHALAEAFRVNGIEAAAVSGDTPKEERRSLLQAFSDGRLMLLANCMVLTEGTDLPRASCILHAKPTKSATLYEQMTGRGLRVLPPDPAGPKRKASPGPFLKSDCVVIDLVDVSRRHSLQTAPVLYGLPPGIKDKGKKLEELANEWEDLQEQWANVDIDKILEGQSMTLAEFAAAAQKVDIWRIPDLGAFSTGRKMDWMRQGVGVDVYRIEYPLAAPEGHEALTVRPALVGWEVVSAFRPKGGVGGTSRVLATGIATAEAAASLAEAFIEQERPSVVRIKASDAPWKKNPASTKQRAFLLQRHIPHDPKKLTAGQASQLIDLWMSRHRR